MDVPRVPSGSPDSSKAPAVIVSLTAREMAPPSFAVAATTWIVTGSGS